ncbi:hypothetical protein QC763_608005 [Podospora pseudopauciseta]|uniref:DUF7587 domain-containing protein n=1 Tax=Podospora pseudopauciseta TaxID=2093780 RepID=A0ABR0H5Q5_9PEZI|nr:hypothetical protein QC763_608005 [Podospora pseudopauciseta]
MSSIRRIVTLMSDSDSDSEPGSGPSVEESLPLHSTTNTSDRVQAAVLQSDSEPISEPQSIPSLQKRLPFYPPRAPIPNDHLQYFRSNDIPRYLFRVYTPKSCGETTTSHVRPLSTTAPGHPEPQCLDIFASFHPDIAHRYPDRITHPSVTAELLRRHFNFACWPNASSNCPFVSWSSSLLFVLHYALCRSAYFDHRRDSNGKVAPGVRTNWKDVKVLLLDTTKLPRRTFISEVELLKFFVSYEPDKCQSEEEPLTLKKLLNLRLERHNKGYYYGEYLSQGDLNIAGACVQTDLESLKDRGLFRLVPVLGEQWRWGKNLVRGGGIISLRRKLHSSDNPASTEEVLQAIHLGELFYSRHLDLTVPAAAMFLALKKRIRQDPVILGVFKEKFRADITDVYQLVDTSVPTELTLLEVTQFRILIQDIQEHFDYLEYVDGMFSDDDTEHDEPTDLIVDAMAHLDLPSDTDSSS